MKIAVKGMAVMILSLLLIACTSEVLPPPSPTISPPALPPTLQSDQELLQQHPDYLDEALQQLEEVE